MVVRPNLKDYDIASLRRLLAGSGRAPYRAEQIAAWLYARGLEDPEAMTDLASADRSWLSESFETRALEVETVERSFDGTCRAILRARDGARIESVTIPEPGRTTLCVSTQVGCPLACDFCATGAMGFQRNLTASEIVDQVCRMRELLALGRRITNVVFMGMGEPLLNLANLRTAIRLLVHPKAFAMAPRRLTVSTVGVVPRIGALLAVAPVNLAISLHATRDALRDRLVPINRRFPLSVLMEALRREPRIDRRHPVFFEYTLIAGVNDSREDALGLAPLLRGIPSKLNVIPMNAHPDSPLRPPPEEEIARFVGEVAATGVRVTLRRSRGPDIDAACGQLALRPGRRVAGPNGSAGELAAASS